LIDHSRCVATAAGVLRGRKLSEQLRHLMWGRMRMHMTSAHVGPAHVAGVC
jgi:hypothetical protein